VQVRADSLQFGSDLITLFGRQIHGDSPI